MSRSLPYTPESGYDSRRIIMQNKRLERKRTMRKEDGRGVGGLIVKTVRTEASSAGKERPDVRA
jgi:hypothetical protein